MSTIELTFTVSLHYVVVISTYRYQWRLLTSACVRTFRVFDLESQHLINSHVGTSYTIRTLL